MKWLVVTAFVLIIGSLGAAMFFLIRDKGSTRNVAWALSFRVGFSILLFGILMLSWYMGWIETTGIPVTRQ